MVEIFLKTLPFFMLIGLGFWAGRSGFFSEEASAYLTKFVFFFALSAMLFRFSANLSLAEVLSWEIVGGYLAGTVVIYLLATAVAMLRRVDMATAAVEAQCAVIGNVGFLGIPMLSLLMGPEAVGTIMLVLAVDLIVFSSLIVILITASRQGRMNWNIFGTIAMGLIKNPMIMAIALGLAVSALDIPVPGPINEFLIILGAAATPGALFAIGSSLAAKSTERMRIALWLSFCKLALHPAAVAVGVLWLFPVDPYRAGVVIAAAALPVAGNIYILAHHYRVAPQRASAAILLSTTGSIVTVSAIIAWVASI